MEDRSKYWEKTYFFSGMIVRSNGSLKHINGVLTEVPPPDDDSNRDWYDNILNCITNSFNVEENETIRLTALNPL